MDVDSTFQRLAQILHGIYVQTTKERCISENNYQITTSFLQTSDLEETFIVDESSTKEPRSCTCNIISLKKRNALESSVAEKIETVVKKAQSIRLSDELGSKNLKKTVKGKEMKTFNCYNASKLPRINKPLPNSARNSKCFIKENPRKTQKETIKEKPHGLRPNSASHIRLRGGCELVKTNKNTFYKVTEHVNTCPLSKEFQAKSTSSLKSSVQLLPASLKEIRLTPDLQKLLKLYYHFLEEKEKTVTRSRSKCNFIAKLNTINDYRWKTFQHKDEFPLGTLKKLINSYTNFFPLPLRCSRTCYYSDVKILVSLQTSTNELEKLTILQEIFYYIQEEIFKSVVLEKMDKKLVPAFYKCIQNIINIYDNGYSKNNVVLKI